MFILIYFVDESYCRAMSPSSSSSNMLVRVLFSNFAALTSRERCHDIMITIVNKITNMTAADMMIAVTAGVQKIVPGRPEGILESSKRIVSSEPEYVSQRNEPDQSKLA